MLRFVLQPDHLEQQRLEELVEFCQQGRVDDVMFFIDPLNLRHITLEEAKPWMEMIGRAKRLLEPMGVTTSINPLNTLLHDSAYNSLLEGQSFRLMVDPYGNQATTVVCPLCPEWRKYITEIYAYYATLQPYSLWVEDDFRLHNHSPLVWGGCFCEDHMREYARQAGVESLERQDFVRGLLASGDPHEYRRIWLDSCRQVMVELAEAIGEAVHQVSPNTRIGLMTSVPSVHAAEARDWHGIMKAFDGKQSAIVRPHLPAYMETSGIHYSWEFNGTSRLTAAFLPEYTEMFPEIENVPYTSYSKSKAFQKYQVETALLLGSRGITLNIIDMVGNGLYPEEQATSWLSEEKDFLNAVASLSLHTKNMTGVQVLVSERSSYHLHTKSDNSMEALYPQETFWASLLSAYGVANTYAVEWPESGGVIALSGQILRKYDESQIRELFESHVVLLEGDAVHTLYAMGLGSLCGVTQAVWREAQTIEQIINKHEYSGIKEGRMRPYLVSGRYLDLQYEPGTVDIISQIANVRGEALCPGMTIVNGRIFILPYGQDGFQGLLNPIRRAVLQETIGMLGLAKPLMITSYAPHLSVYEFRAGNRQSIAIANHSLDDIEGIELSGTDLTDDSWKLLSRHEPLGQQMALQSIGDRTAINARFPALTLTVLHRQKQI
ncbi:hypothetical protein [Cohnella abietis]|nr:hypothetical protein [Cohnella abietis]